MPRGVPSKRKTPPKSEPKSKSAHGQKKVVFVPRFQVGPPLLLTPDIIEQVSRLLPKCFYLETVMNSLGIARDTWKMWLKEGHRVSRKLADLHISGKIIRKVPDLTEYESLCFELLISYKLALAKGEIKMTSRIGRHSLDSWQAAAWLLERRFPEKWGNSSREIRELRELLMDTLKKLATAEGRVA